MSSSISRGVTIITPPGYREAALEASRPSSPTSEVARGRRHPGRGGARCGGMPTAHGHAGFRG